METPAKKTKKTLDTFVWLFIWPALSLVMVYLILGFIDRDISRLAFIILVLLALLLPVTTLAIGIMKALGWKKTRFIPLAVGTSSLFWVVVAYGGNTAFPSPDVDNSVLQSALAFGAYWIASSCILYIWHGVHHVVTRPPKQKRVS